MRLVGNVYWYPERGLGDCNTYLVRGDPTILVDPGSPRYLRRRLREMEEDGVEVEEIGLIVNTHSHPDHCGANRPFQELSGAKILIHREEEDHLKFSLEFGRYFGMEVPRFEVDAYLGERVGRGETELLVLHTPGHSPGSVSLYHEGLRLLLCGDLVFEGGVGRTDFPGGSEEELARSIERVSGLGLQYLLPGHGSVLRGEERIRRNFEFVKGYFL
ncbi:MAG: MBL fold metallo-hydrolase [Hadesarchaea archaeon]|jgi:glyoxylase-like metal-dependent hydrolase (beta-lactamase superfamily II)|nr:MAG: MBL fold metallo-hydrolase [Hadesarchaea archaeon]